MSNPEYACPQCGKGILINGECPMCGFCMPESLKQRDQRPQRSKRAALWAWFWVLFLGTPVVGFLGLASVGGAVIPFLLAGTAGAGFVLARIFAKDSAMFGVLGIVFSICVAAVYLGIFFVGCLVMLNGAHF